MKNFNRNLKGISPIFATLILIAIAVIAGVVVYMFTSGTLATMTGGGVAGTEKMQIQAVQPSTLTAGVGTITIYAQSQASPLTVSSVILKNAAGTVIDTATPATALQIGTSLSTVVVQVVATNSAVDLTFPAGTSSYTLTLITPAGGNFVSPSFSVTR